MTHEIEAVRYEPSRRAELVELMVSVWGDAQAGEHVEWWFDESPVEPGIVLLAEVDGRLAGTLGTSYLPMLIGGERQLAAMPLRAASRPEFRGRGVFSKLVLEHEEVSRQRGARVAVSIPNEQSRAVFLRLGWRKIGARRVWVRPLRLRSAPQLPRPPVRRYRGLAVEPLERFDARAEAAWRRAAPLYGDHVVGDAAWLNWRYIDAPHAYRCFHAGEHGYAVVRRLRERGIEVGIVCTLVAASARATAALLARAADELRGCQMLAALRPPAHAATWLAAGYLPSPRTMTVIGKPLVDGQALPADPAFQFGDNDFV